MLKKNVFIPFLFLSFFAFAESPPVSSLEVGFSPGGTAVKLVLEVIGEAKSLSSSPATSSRTGILPKP